MRRQDWKEGRLLSFLLFFCYPGIAGAITSCSSATLASQEDANAFSGCSTISGNVVLATNAVGNIVLEGVQVIEGSLSTADCSSGTTSSCSGLLSLSSSTLSSMSNSLKLQSFSNLLNISFPQLLSTGPTFSLDELSSLQTLTIPKLSSADSFFIRNTPKLTSLNLDVLTNVTSFYINNVALSALPLINSISNITSFTASGINNVSSIILNTTSIGLLDIQGNGTLRLGFLEASNVNNTIHDSQVSAVETLNVSGCKSIVFTNMTISAVNMTGNNITVSNLEQVRDLQNIYFIDNPMLEEVIFPDTTVLNNLTLSNNPLLGTESLFWNALNITSVTLTGALPAAFVDMVLSHILYVLGDVYVDTPGSNCDRWNSLREEGHILGNYSCNGKTVAIKNTGSTSYGFESGWVLILWTAIFTIFCM